MLQGGVNLRKNAISSTAMFIAEGLTILSQHPKYCQLIPEPDRHLARQAIQSAGCKGSLWLKFIESRLGRFAYSKVCSLLSPGTWAHHVLRKRFIDKQVRNAISDGYTSVIVLAAGFDALTYRLHAEYPQVTFIEVDLPDTQAAKKHCIPNYGPNVHFVPADLSRQSIQDVLAAVPKRPKDKSVVVLEGLSMYLSEPEISQLLAGIAVIPDKDVRLVFTFFEPTSLGTIAFERTTTLGFLWLHLKKEKYRWGIERTKLPLFFDKLGFQLDLLVKSSDFLTECGIEGELVAQGELIAIGNRK